MMNLGCKSIALCIGGEDIIMIDGVEGLFDFMAGEKKNQSEKKAPTLSTLLFLLSSFFHRST